MPDGGNFAVEFEWSSRWKVYCPWRHVHVALCLWRDGQLLLDEEGQVPLEQINAAISQATGLPAPQGESLSLSFNELNTEVISR